MKTFLLILLSLISIAQDSTASEPAYCDPETFFKNEIQTQAGIWRHHTFRFGDVILLGGAIGYSNPFKVTGFAENNSTATSAEKYCTWYYNEGNDFASTLFNHHYVSNPQKVTEVTGPEEYREVLKDQFAKANMSFLSCLENHKYLAMGCNGQMHRGPTVFGMLLSFSGCSSKNSLTIVNKLWGANGVKPEVRQAIIEEGFSLGNDDPQARLRMQKVLGY